MTSRAATPFVPQTVLASLVMAAGLILGVSGAGDWVTVHSGSFLGAGVFTSVVSFGIAAMAMGLGIVFVLIGLARRAVRSPSSA